MAHKKLKILYLAKYLTEQTDETHPASVSDLIGYLDSLGIPAERKAIYDDLELLETFGMDIVHVRGKSHGYYLGQRKFELPELKLLIDVVQASPFLTAKKSMELIGKLEGLASAAQAGSLRRQVYVLNRVKTHNEQLYYNIDGINQAVQDNHQIRFRYFDWAADGGRQYRREGAYYEETPVALCVDRNYYLIAYRAAEGKYIHFRVDRMSDLRVAEEKRPLLPEGFDLASYVRTIFDMHSGDRQWVTLELDKSLINVAMDRFGREAHYRKGKGETVVVSAQVEVSPTFLSWVLCFGGQAKILEPSSAREALQALAQEALARYDEEE